MSTAYESKEAACSGSCGSEDSFGGNGDCGGGDDDCGGEDDGCGGEDDDCGGGDDDLTLPEAQASACADEQAASYGAHRPSR